MSFAALETRANASVIKHLANVQATLGGATVPGIFRNAQTVASGGVGMATTDPMLSVLSEHVPANPVGETLTINGVVYAIAAPEPDGTGMTVLILERTS